MNEVELREYVVDLQNRRASFQTFKAKLEESERTKIGKKPKEATKVVLEGMEEFL